MSLFVVDVEADGPCPGLYSMVSIGIIKVQADLASAPTFFGQVAPISDRWIPDALAVSRISRDQHLAYPSPASVIPALVAWVLGQSKGRPVFVSDNPLFDGAWVNYYTHAFADGNPFGHSGRRIGDLYSGLEKDFFASSRWKKFRRTPHTHNPVDDARGNAEALLAFAAKHGLKLPVS